MTDDDLDKLICPDQDEGQSHLMLGRLALVVSAALFIIALVIAANFAERVWTDYNAERLEADQ